jgi:hypothetical protein
MNASARLSVSGGVCAARGPERRKIAAAKTLSLIRSLQPLCRSLQMNCQEHGVFVGEI